MSHGRGRTRPPALLGSMGLKICGMVRREAKQVEGGGIMKHVEPFEEGDTLYNIDTVTCTRYGIGVAVEALGWETKPDKDTEWSGYEVRTGLVMCCMIGDDHLFYCDPEELTPLPREAYCGECGQVGCTHDGYDRGASDVL